MGGQAAANLLDRRLRRARGSTATASARRRQSRSAALGVRTRDRHTPWFVHRGASVVGVVTRTSAGRAGFDARACPSQGRPTRVPWSAVVGDWINSHRTQNARCPPEHLSHHCSPTPVPSSMTTMGEPRRTMDNGRAAYVAHVDGKNVSLNVQATSCSGRVRLRDGTGSRLAWRPRRRRAAAQLMTGEHLLSRGVDATDRSTGRTPPYEPSQWEFPCLVAGTMRALRDTALLTGAMRSTSAERNVDT